MRKLIFELVAISMVAGLFSGCATTWSDRERGQLSSVAVGEVTVDKEAYKKPDAKDSPDMANKIPMATLGGLIPSLIGSAIDASVTAKQQRNFEKENAQYFSELAAHMPAPPVKELQIALKHALAANDFFGPRLGEVAPANFTLEIVSYGFQKSPRSQNGIILLRVQIVAHVSIKLPDGTILWNALISGVASTAACPKDILTDSTFVATGFNEASINFAGQVLSQLAPKIRNLR